MTTFKPLNWTRDDGSPARWFANGLHGSFCVSSITTVDGLYKLRFTPWSGMNTEHSPLASVEDAMAIAQEENNKAVQVVLDEWTDAIAR